MTAIFDANRDLPKASCLRKASCDLWSQMVAHDSPGDSTATYRLQLAYGLLVFFLFVLIVSSVAAADSWNILDLPPYTGAVEEEIRCDVCVIGGGTAGSAAAIMAAREGASVVLVERQPLLGGTGTNAMVAGWEPGPGCSLCREIFDRMASEDGAGVGYDYPLRGKLSYGFFLVTEGEIYETTTHRTGVPRREFRDVPYKPEAFDRAVRALCREMEKVTVMDETLFFQAEPNEDRNRVESVLVRCGDEKVRRIRAGVFVDSTGDVWLCRALGCETMLGIEPKKMFDEPSAPEEGALQLNAITRCYEIVRKPGARRAAAPESSVPFPKAAHITGWKDGPLYVNMMPTLPGRTLIDHGYDETLRRSEAIVHAHWHWLQQCPDFQDFELVRIAPMLGIREGHRVRTKYVLREQDLIDTLKNQRHKDIIAVADHPCDIHGAGGGLRHLTGPYGVPYRCLVPEGGWQNLLVACRGAGFSRIAASSCRLQRTMIQLGHAAGIAAARASKNRVPVDRIDAEALARELDVSTRYDEYRKPQTVPARVDW